jgi:hypothetical protein
LIWWRALKAFTWSTENIYSIFSLWCSHKKFDLDDSVKSLNSPAEKSRDKKCANFVFMRRTDRALSECKMQSNTEVGFFARPSIFEKDSDKKQGIQIFKGLRSNWNAGIMKCNHAFSMGNSHQKNYNSNKLHNLQHFK